MSINLKLSGWRASANIDSRLRSCNTHHGMGVKCINEPSGRSLNSNKV